MVRQRVQGESPEHSFCFVEIPTLDFLAPFTKTKGKVRMKHDTGQQVLQLGFDTARLRFPWNTYFCTCASLLAALQNGIVWPRSSGTPLPWFSVVYRIPVIFLALLSWLYPLQMGKKVFLQFGRPAFAEFLTWNSGLHLQYFTLFVNYLFKHLLAPDNKPYQV